MPIHRPSTVLPTWFPKNPAILKDTTVILIHYGVVAKHYNGSKTLRQGLWNTLFFSGRKFTGNSTKSSNYSGDSNPDLPFLAFSVRSKESDQKKGFFFPRLTPKILGKKGKNTQKTRGSSQEKKQGIPKRQGKEDQGNYYVVVFWIRPGPLGERAPK